MPLLDLKNPDVIRFYTENYEKTTRLRLKWNRVHSDKLKDAATLQREEKGYYEADVLREAMACGMPAITRDHIVAGNNRRLTPLRDATFIPGTAHLRKGHSIVEVGLGNPEEDPRLARPDTDFSIDPVMRPIDPQQRQILYDNVPTYGRVAYLKSRNRMQPENKYYFQESTGWTYGWRLKDSYFSRNAPKCGKVFILTRGIKSRSGPHPDPPHYKDSEPPGVAKCGF